MTEEDKLQCRVAGFLNGHLLPPAVFCHVPNGGYRHAREAKKLKDMGVKAGWPDIQIFWRDQMNLHLSVGMIELKAPKKGRVSDVQIDCHAALRDLDCRVAVCRSLEDVKSALDTWRIPLRSVSLSTERMTAAIKKLRAREAAAGEVA